MKKIFVLVCFAFSVSVLSQTIKANKLVVNSATKSNAATRVVVQDSLTKEYHWILKSSIGGGSVPTIDEVLDAGNTSIDKSISITTASSSDYASLNYNQLNVSDGDYLGRLYKNSLQFVDNVANTTANFSKDGLQLITSGSTSTSVFFTSPTGINSISIPDKSGTIAMLDDVGSVTLPEFQIPFGQVGDVFGSDSTLTYEGGTLSINGVDALTTANGQTLDSDLTDISSLAPPNDNILQRKAGVWTSRTPAQFKTDLSLVKADVGLSNVDNTSDANKPISTAVASEYNSVSGLTFSGAVDLSKKGGALYNDHTQTATINFSVPSTTPGAYSTLVIIANGNPINPVGTWKNVGSDTISTTSGAVNRFIFLQTATETWYSVKVN